MINVSHKSNTLRYARAEGYLEASSETMLRVEENTVPKGDVKATARAAGISAAKRSSDIMVFCHPMPLDWVDVSVEIDGNRLKASCEVETVWKTGVEMEAITGVSAALLNAFDMLKPLDKEMKMTDIQVVKKRGGKSHFKEEFLKPLKAAVLVISDSTFEGTREDKSGKIIKEFLEEQPVDTAVYDILPDNMEQIRERIHTLVKDEGFDLVITTGGTGFGPKDVTVEATRPILEKLAPGIAEKIRDYGTQRTPYAMLSREVAGTVGNSLILNLPGSSNGARESMQALFPGVLHIFPMLWGGGHEKPKE